MSSCLTWLGIVLILLIYIKDPFELNLCVTKGFCEEALGNWRKHCEATSQITSRLVSKDQVVEFWIGAILKAKILVFHYYQNLTILPGFDITIPIVSPLKLQTIFSKSCFFRSLYKYCFSKVNLNR